MALENRSVVWVDAGGGSTITLIRSDGGAAAIQSAMLLCQNADYLQFWESAVLDNASPSPTAAVYQSVTQRANLVFICADTTNAVLQLLGPKSSIFLSDGRTIDLTNADVSALSIACVGALVSASGSPAVAVVAGFLAG